MDAIRPYLTAVNLTAAATAILALVAIISAWHAARSAKGAQEDAEHAREDARLAREYENAMRAMYEEHVELLRREDERREAAEQREEERLAAAERERERQAKKANMFARITRVSTNARSITVRNDGPAKAREVSVKLDGVPIMEHELFARQRPPRKEQTSFGAPDEVSYQFPRDAYDGTYIRVSISWEDDSGEPGEWEEPLRIW